MMDIPFLCVLILLLSIYLPKLLQVIAAQLQFSKIDYKYPRDQQLLLTGWGKRALGAHLNSFEMFPMFSVTVIIAHIQMVDSELLTKLCISFIAIRLIYIIFYLSNLSTLRTLSWLMQMVIIVWIFILAL